MNSSTSFQNMSLFIKRAEDHQTKEFIINAFADNSIGKVADVKFIKKQNHLGKKYNGVIVIFERWNMNTLVQKLLNEMASSPDGTTQFYFNRHRYWVINVHKVKLPECSETLTANPNSTPTEQIHQLQQIIQSMSAQMFYMQSRQEQSERTMMDYEQKDTRRHLVSVELTCKLDEKDNEYACELDELKDTIKTISQDYNSLLWQKEETNNSLNDLHKLYDKLNQELIDERNIVAYMKTQMTEIKQMLENVPDVRVAQYVKEYL